MAQFNIRQSNELFSDAIRNQIIEFIEDSVPTRSTLTPVKNGRDYCRRLRCVQWAYDLADAADLLDLPWSTYNAPIKETIKSAEAYLAFQRSEYFRLLALVPDGESFNNDCEKALEALMAEEGVSAGSITCSAHVEIALARKPSRPWEIKRENRVSTRRIDIAEGYEKLREDDCPNGIGLHAWDFEAHTWDCPACGSLLLAINHLDHYGTKDTDPVKCPVCGDHSAYIYGSHGSSVECLIHGSSRISDQEGKKIVGID